MLIEQVLATLRSEFLRHGKPPLFDRLKPHLCGEDDAPTYHDLGNGLGLSAGALRVLVHRLRRRYQELLRAEIAQTVSTPDEVDEEIHHLMRVVAS